MLNQRRFTSGLFTEGLTGREIGRRLLISAASALHVSLKLKQGLRLPEFERMNGAIIKQNIEAKRISDYGEEKHKIVYTPKTEFSDLFERPKAVMDIEK